MPNQWDRQHREHFPEGSVLACPVCGEMTDHLKQFKYLDCLLYVITDATIRYMHYRACPGCMRKWIASRAALNVVSANLLWLPIVLPWGLVLVAKTYQKGHSRAALSHNPPEFAVRHEVPDYFGELSWPRVWAVLGLLLSPMPIFGLVFALYACTQSWHARGWPRTVSLIAVALSVPIQLAYYVAYEL